MAKAKKLPSGNWRCQVYAGKDVSGKKIMKSFTAPTKKEAEYMAAAFQMEKEKPEITNISLREALEQYIESKENILSPTTLRGYHNILNNHLLELQNLNLSSITHLQVQKAINAMSLKSSPKTIRNVIGLYYAATKKYTNVFSDISSPPRTHKEIKIPQNDEISLLLQNTTGDLRTGIALAALAGLRSGEVLGLMWDKVDFSKNLITIDTSLAYGVDNIYTLKTPKSYAGMRKIPISAALKNILADAPKTDEFLVHYRPQSLYHAFRRTCERLGLPHYRFHDLRHYYASVLLAANIPDKYAMELMGHATNSTLKYIYQHTMQDKREEFYSRLDNVFSNFL